MGYSTSIYGWPNTAVITVFPVYDGRIKERLVDVGQRTLFDFRDTIYATVQPNNGFVFGNTYQTNAVTINPKYTPSVSNLIILPNTVSYDGINTSHNVSASNTLNINYNYNSGGFISTNIYQNSTRPNSTNMTIYNWYKLIPTGVQLIISSASLSSGLVAMNDQIYCSLVPGLLNQDGSIGYGNTVLSDVYNVGS